ncbi:MAG: acyl-CoA dehydrogenase family protein [Trebonia sp.]
MSVLRDHWTNEVRFEDCAVPAGNLIGAEGQGFGLAQEWLVRGRLRYAAQAVGVAEEAVRIASDWAKQRETFGALLATRQAVQFAIADARIRISAARHLTWEAAWDADQGRDARTANRAGTGGTARARRRTAAGDLQLHASIGAQPRTARGTRHRVLHQRPPHRPRAGGTRPSLATATNLYPERQW